LRAAWAEKKHAARITHYARGQTMTMSRKYIIALTAALGLIPVVLDTTIVNIALIPIATALHADLNTVQWVFTGYLLANGAALAAGGYLGNMLGVKRLFLLGIGLFTFFSALCGLANSEGLLIAFRVLQGLGGGLLIPLGQAIAFEQFAPEERARASAVVGIPILMAPVLGPILGGFMLDNLGWQSIFFINVPIGIVVVLLGLRVLPADPAPTGATRGRFEWPGLALLTAGVAAILYGVKQVTQTAPGTVSVLHPAGTIYGWGDGTVWAWLGSGAVLLIGFAVVSLFFSRDPVLDLRLFRMRDFGTATLVNLANAVITFGTILLLPVFLEQVRLPHLSAFDTAVTLMPLGLASLAGTILGARLYDRIGVKPLVLVGAALGGLAAWQLTSLTPTTGGGQIWPWLTLIGLGLGLTSVPVQTLALQRLSGPILTKASSLATSSRLIMASVGGTVLTTVFLQQTNAHVATLQAAALGSLPAGTVPDLTNPAVQAAIQQLGAQAGTLALNDVFAYIAAGTLLVMLLALLLPGRQHFPATEGARAEVVGV
jgi:EmrB/QacA subfamily drug resistance transporter